MNRDEIARLLPEVFRRSLKADTPLYAFLGAMEGMHAPAEAVLARLEDAFDPYRCPDRFLAVLTTWLDLNRFMRASPAEMQEPQGERDLLSTGNGHLRELIAAALALSQWRGTEQGLRRALQVATGLSGFAISEQVADDDGNLRPFHIQVLAPPSALRHEALVRRIVEQEKPAYVTFDLVFENND